MALIEDTGFDAFGAGTLAELLRRQPGALVAAEAGRLPKRRALAVAVIQKDRRGRHEPRRRVRRPP
ncbi:hypothetical protein [Streptomyces sp. ADI97-07]|uniref:hypothetical protein n=1 Tax=Streptomyces sp. ADI97-07 TaxID=1522762 RepID=UPI0019D0E646|nr:hypothetical protein [Streptomyces sp. ADI97-07]